MTPTFHHLTIKDLRRETADTVSISFDIPGELKEAYQYTQGQYVTLRAFLHGEDVRRSYSICSSPLDGELRVAVKKVEGGRFSTFANEVLKTGDGLDVMTPLGNFFTPLDPNNHKHYVGFASGSGITPILSILKTALLTEPHSRFTLFYGNRHTESIIFREELEGLKNRFMNRFSLHHVLSREHPGADLFFGHIDADKCNRFCNLLLDPADIDEVFVCGPEPMMHAVRETMQQNGVSPKHIHLELFTSPAGPLLAKTKGAETGKRVLSHLTLVVDGKSFSFELDSASDTILDAALKSGADLPFACKGGVCSTCKARVLEGRVDMEVNYALEPEEVEAGYVLTCQSHPRSEKVVVSYDE